MCSFTDTHYKTYGYTLTILHLVTLIENKKKQYHYIGSGHSLRALLLMSFYDYLLSVSLREADVLAVPGHARAEVDVGQHRHAGFMQQAAAQFFGVGRADQRAGLGDVGPGVERAARP